MENKEIDINPNKPKEKRNYADDILINFYETLNLRLEPCEGDTYNIYQKDERGNDKYWNWTTKSDIIALQDFQDWLKEYKRRLNIIN